MHTEQDKMMLRRIRNILMLVGSGNLMARLGNSGREGVHADIKELAALLNPCLEQIGSFFYHDGFANHAETYQCKVTAFLILDGRDNIITISEGMKALLAITDADPTTKPFTHFLTETAKTNWKNLKTSLAQRGKKPSGQHIVLSFKSEQHTNVTMSCLVDSLQSDERTIVTAVKIEKEREQRKRELFNSILAMRNNESSKPASAMPKKYQITLNRTETQNVKKAHELYKIHIKKKPHEPLPTVKQVAKECNLSENRLKAGFRQRYGKSPYELFYQEHLDRQLARRLEIAKPLVKETEITFREIAHIAGYKHLSNLCHAFVQEFGKTPSEIRDGVANNKK